MTPELKKFAQQLSLWTELIIENGRTPFRRADLYPEIYTDQGKLQPPLVFWINRQSMMAGGILLLPEQDVAAELQRGRSCCDALGLKHFVTWESDRVRIWQLASGEIQQYQQFDLSDTEHPDAFRHLLGEVLETLKLLAVIGLVPNRELSAHYLHNLFQATLELALPALVNSYRSQRAVDLVSSNEDADLLAKEANRLLMLQLLGLAWHQKLPSAILPEKLERAIQLSLPQLPAALQKSLSAPVTTAPPEVPLETAVCFHHLLLRLRQLSWRETEERALTSIQLLISSWGKGAPPSSAKVQLYPQGPLVDQRTELVLSDSPSLLAAIKLLEDLLGTPPQELQLGNVFQLNLSARTDLTISANLTGQRLLAKEERHQYTALLRTSWPNRRFRIGGDKPLWLWELIHLLGLCRQQNQLLLTLPEEVVQSPAAEPSWLLLWETYSIQTVTPMDNEQIELTLLPEPDQAEEVAVLRPEGTRSFPTSDDLPRFRNQLLLSLHLPDDIYQLLNNKLGWPTEELDTDAVAGQQVYLRSRLAKRIEQVLGLDLQNLSAEKLKQELSSFPQPDRLNLKELGLLTKNAAAAADPDQLLAELIQSPALESIELTTDDPRRATTSPKPSTKGLRD